MQISRRTFLRRTGLVMLGAAGARIGLDCFTPLGQSALAAALGEAGPLPLGTPIVVLVDMQGGNDSVNVLINPSDPWYYDMTQGHGAIAVPEAQLLPLSGSSYALNPNMSWTASQWSNGNLAFVLGPGENVVHEFSHFAAMYYRQVADFTGTVSNGWLGRYNDLANTGSPFASVSLVGVHPSLIGDKTPVLSVPDVPSFDFTVGWQWESDWLAAWQAMGTGGSLTGTAQQAAAQNIANTFTAQSSVLATTNNSWESSFGSTPIGHQLAQVAMMITAGIPCQTYVVTLTGFDTHGNEVSTQDPLLSQIDTALQDFFAAIAAGPRANDVFVHLTSEFGRQETANASAGCDHGQAGTDILLGGGVVGGLYGEAPDTDPAARLDDALVPTVDFRCVYATVLNRLSGDTETSASVLLQPFEDLGIFGTTSGGSSAITARPRGEMPVAVLR
jgi:uncharacterized protein (DUF1501 family)